MIILAILITMVLSVVGCYLVLRPRLKQTQELDRETQEHNVQLSAKAKELYDLIISEKAEEQSYQNRIEVLKTSTAAMEEQSKTAADLIYQKNLQQATDSLNKSLELENQRYQDTIAHFQSELELIQSEGASEYSRVLEEQQQNLQEKQQILDELQATVDAAVAAAKRQEEIKDNNNFYRIQLQKWEIDEIEILRSITPKLKNVEPLNKVIWKCYYEKPTTDLIGRVIGSGTHTGIYKITNIENQKCYVGQAANLADRWKQHIKRGVGADTPTRNKLYPAMLELGPENFTFEVIEECDRSLLDAREDYWQDFFKAKEFGYSIK